MKQKPPIKTNILSIELKPITNNASKANSYLKISYINIAIGIALILHSFFVKSKSSEINSSIKQLGSKYTIANNEWLSTNINLSIFLSIMTFVTFIVFITWSYRVYKNLHLNSDYVAYNPSWAIWGYFLPVLNFIRPQQVMTDLVKRNSKLIQTVDSEHNKKFPLFLISIWWLFYIAYCITNNLSISIPKDSFINYTTVYDISTVNISKGLFFLVVVTIQIKMVKYVRGIETRIVELTKEKSETDIDESQIETED
jgi:hypothetical protein